MNLINSNDLVRRLCVPCQLQTTLVWENLQTCKLIIPGSPLDPYPTLESLKHMPSDQLLAMGNARARSIGSDNRCGPRMHRGISARSAPLLHEFGLNLTLPSGSAKLGLACATLPMQLKPTHVHTEQPNFAPLFGGLGSVWNAT
jgi:hypothetical protein